MIAKVCPKCKQEKDIKEFHRYANIKDKQYPLCKACRYKSQRDYYQAHPRECKLQSHKRNEKLRLEVFQHYSGGVQECAICGEADPLVLTLDHIGGGGEQHRRELNKKGTSFYYWLRREKYPEGYQVLCCNCNTRIWKLKLKEGIEL